MRATPTQYRQSPRITSARVAPFALIAALLVAACGGDGANGPTSNFGTYTLSTVQGKGLPYRVFSDVNYSVDVSQGTVALNADGSFLATLRSEERVDNHLSVYADTAKGTFTLAGTTVTFLSPDGFKQSGTLANRTLTVVDSSNVVPLTFVYSMQ